MNKYYRLTLSVLSIIVLLILGIYIEGGINNLLIQFWFSSGMLLIVLLSLVDQPFFSKDSNVFVNSITALLPLLLLTSEVKEGLFYIILNLVLYLAMSSFILMFIRKNKFVSQNKYVLFFSNLNQLIGKPLTLFSVLFLWGLSIKYAFNTKEFNFLLTFWVMFLILNNNGIYQGLSNIFNKGFKSNFTSLGNIFAVIAQNTFMVKLNNNNFVDKFDLVKVRFSGDNKIHTGFIFEKILLDNEQWLKVITYGELESQLNNKLIVDEVYPVSKEDDLTIDISSLVGIISEGSSIEKIKFHYSSNQEISAGTVLEVSCNGETVLYQIVDAKTELINLSMMNQSGYIQGEAVQLGTWNIKQGKFTKYGWVPEINTPVFLARNIKESELLEGEINLGNLPNTNYPIILNKELAVTHHMAVVGVTGTGKSVFSRNLIKEFLGDGTKVICIDLTGEYKEKFLDEKPTEIIKPDIAEELFKTIGNIEKIMDKNFNKDNDESRGLKLNVFRTMVHQINSFLDGQHNLALLELPEIDNSSSIIKYTQTFFKALFKIAKERKDPNNKICLVLEEAHTIIPEWNFSGVNDKSSQPLINSIAQIALQGRKYNIGLLVIAQRTANVSKTILTQCNSIVAFQQYDKTSIDFLSNYFGTEISAMLPQLKFRQAVVAGKAFRSNSPMLLDVPEIIEYTLEELEEGEQRENLVEVN
ncbi:ATP-binding protein [Ornithinibacillus bavariensis]|uniref:ATP-binding protein n=1 Tax=Ornithinibacillus bavariensis TaxID=545502 RepID=UPI000ECDBC12|nr:ATP-binding protein [Ornithinibacillus sp.]